MRHHFLIKAPAKSPEVGVEKYKYCTQPYSKRSDDMEHSDLQRHFISTANAAAQMGQNLSQICLKN